MLIDKLVGCLSITCLQPPPFFFSCETFFYLDGGRMEVCAGRSVEKLRKVQPMAFEHCVILKPSFTHDFCLLSLPHLFFNQIFASPSSPSPSPFIIRRFRSYISYVSLSPLSVCSFSAFPISPFIRCISFLAFLIVNYYELYSAPRSTRTLVVTI